MKSYYASLRELVIPSGVAIPGSDAWVFSTDVPQELQNEGITAAQLGYVKTYDPSQSPGTDQLVYDFIGVFAPGAGAKGIVHGFVVEQAGIRNPVYQLAYLYDADTDSSITVVGAFTNDGSGVPVSNAVHYPGAVWNGQTDDETLRHQGSIIASKRGYGTWHQCSLQSGWTHGVQPLQVLRDAAGTVHLEGTINPGTTASGTPIGGIPLDALGQATYNPRRMLTDVARSGNATGVAGIEIDTVGTIRIQNSASGAPALFISINMTWCPFA